MHQRSVSAIWPHHPLFQRLAVVAATLLAGLSACGALLVALGGPVPLALAAPAGLTRQYPGGGSPCDTTLQACIDGSAAGDTIVVQAGTYYTNGLTLNHAVNLTGVSSATVILHALANQRVLTITGAAVDSSVIISGLTFAGGHAVGNNCPAGCGGAILITATAQPLFINLTITNSRADAIGGGLYARVGSPLVMSGAAVLSNTALYAGGGADASSNVTLNAGLFENNQCTGASCVGGGLFTGANLSLTGTQFLSNTSAAGAGAYAFFNATLNGGLFQNNQCTGAGCQGGGLFVGNNLAATNTRVLSNTSVGGAGGVAANGMVTLDTVVFQNNQCTAAGCQGGGLFTGSDLAATNTQFLSNTAAGFGGGAAASGNVTLNGAVFQNNQCTSANICHGAGLYAGSDLVVTNTQFLSNTNNAGAGYGGGAAAYRNVTLNGGVFQNNLCTGASFCYGGGLYAGSDLVATNTRFLNNANNGMFGQGGGAAAFGIVTLSGAVFQNNQCASSGACRGGGLFSTNQLAVTNTVFLGNRGQQGAGLYHDDGEARLVNDLFAANQASGQGDALYLSAPGPVTLLHTTIASSTLGSGSAVYITTGTVGLTNTIIASYTVGIENAGGSLSVQEDYTLFSGVTTHISGTVVSGGRSFTGPAGFVNPAAFDYHLGPGSAAIDTGVNAGITFDIDGDPRPLGNGFDIGYDEANIRRVFLPLVRHSAVPARGQ